MIDFPVLVHGEVEVVHHGRGQGIAIAQLHRGGRRKSPVQVMRKSRFKITIQR